MFHEVLTLDGVDQAVFVVCDFLFVLGVFLRDKSVFFGFVDVEEVDFIKGDLVEIGNFFFLIGFVLLDFEFDFVEDGDELFVFFLDDLLVGPDSMEHVKVIVFIDQGLSVQSMIILGGCDILREYDLISQSLLDIITVVPVVLTFKSHDFLDTLSVNSLQVLLMEEVVEFLLGFLVLLFPGLNVLLQSEALLGDVFAEIALVVEVLLFHGLGVFAQVLVLDSLLVLLGVDVDLATGGC